MIKAELHCHSNFSKNKLGYLPFIYDSVMSVEEIIFQALRKNIGILAITDHDSVTGSLHAAKIVQHDQLPLLIIPGAEITSSSGHILAYGIRENIPPGLTIQQTIDRIHDQQGIAIAAHPYCPFMSVGKAINRYNFDAIECWNAAMPAWINDKAGFVGIAGSDAHEIPSIGKGLTYFPDTTCTVYDVLQSIITNNIKTERNSISYFSSFTHHLAKGITL